MYCKVTNSNIPVVVKTLVISADRPERCALNCMLGHGGITSRRWRYSAYINQMKLRSCKQCFHRRVMSVTEVATKFCSTCYDWNYSHPSMRVVKPSDYPTTQHADSPSPPKGREVLNVFYLYPIELSYDVMIQGVKFCFFNCYQGMWTKASVMTYLKSIGVNEAYGNLYVYTPAIRCKRNPSLIRNNIYEHLKFPVHWSCGITLDQCIDTPMHQLFQGIVKSVMEKTMSWLTQKDTSHYKAFGDYVNLSLSRVHDLGLGWCRMEPFMRGRSYTLGGWQAEQYVAFTRCIILYYSAIRDVVGDKEIGIDEHECMIQSLLCLISRLMSEEEFEPAIILRFVKVFLSSCDMFENKAYIMNEDDAMWYSKGNFLSLLNLPEQISNFGRLRLFWEGSRERSIQQIKPFLINMRQTSSFFKTKLTYMYVNETLDTINKDIIAHVPQFGVSSSNHVYEKHSDFKTYSSTENITLLSSKNVAISVLYISLNLQRNKFYICQRSSVPKRCILYEVIFVDDEGFNKCGLWYAPIAVKAINNGQSYTQDEVSDMTDDFAILCPCISEINAMKMSFTLICKSWKYRNKHNELSYPSLSKHFFSTTIEMN